MPVGSGNETGPPVGGPARSRVHRGGHSFFHFFFPASAAAAAALLFSSVSEFFPPANWIARSNVSIALDTSPLAASPWA